MEGICTKCGCCICDWTQIKFNKAGEELCDVCAMEDEDE